MLSAKSMTYTLKELTAEFLAHRQQLMAFVYGLCRNQHVAEDVLQEVWLKMATFVEKGGRIENPVSWCRTVAKNIVFQQWRSQKNAKVLSDSELLEFLNFVETAFVENDREFPSDRQVALNDCVKDLPQKSKRLLFLKYDEALSITEIAESTQQSTDAVVKALLRLRKALSVCVQKRMRLEELGI
jgi:RNA polymerase sigma-70 factor (ECF subfamily)